MLLKPRRDATPKWLRSIRKIFDRAYKEPEQHPMRLYPKLNSAPLDPEKYRSGMAKDYMEMYGAYPAWFIGLASLKKNGG
jgi:hypothetical protein